MGDLPQAALIGDQHGIVRCGAVGCGGFAGRPGPGRRCLQSGGASQLKPDRVARATPPQLTGVRVEQHPVVTDNGELRAVVRDLSSTLIGSTPPRLTRRVIPAHRALALTVERNPALSIDGGRRHPVRRRRIDVATRGGVPVSSVGVAEFVSLVALLACRASIVRLRNGIEEHRSHSRGGAAQVRQIRRSVLGEKEHILTRRDHLAGTLGSSFAPAIALGWASLRCSVVGLCVGLGVYVGLGRCAGLGVCASLGVCTSLSLCAIAAGVAQNVLRRARIDRHGTAETVREHQPKLGRLQDAARVINAAHGVNLTGFGVDPRVLATGALHPHRRIVSRRLTSIKTARHHGKRHDKRGHHARGDPTDHRTASSVLAAHRGRHVTRSSRERAPHRTTPPPRQCQRAHQ